MSDTSKNEHVKSIVLSDLELYEFDLTGYVILRQFLSTDVVGKINHLIDNYQGSQSPRKFPFLHIDSIFLDLMTNRRVMDICSYFLGPQFRLDHVYGLQSSPIKNRSESAEKEDLHAGPYANQGAFRYHWFNGRP